MAVTEHITGSLGPRTSYLCSRQVQGSCRPGGGFWSAARLGQGGDRGSAWSLHGRSSWVRSIRADGPSGEWSGRAGWCASRDCCIGLAAFLADLRSAPPPAASQPALAATQGGTAANRFAGLLSCHGDTARTADLPSLPNLRDHNGPGRIPAGTAIGTGACLA